MKLKAQHNREATGVSVIAPSQDTLLAPGFYPNKCEDCLSFERSEVEFHSTGENPGASGRAQ